MNTQAGKGWFAAPVSTLEGALLETEGLGSKTLSAKDNLHNIVAGLFQVRLLFSTYIKYLISIIIIGEGRYCKLLQASKQVQAR